MPRHGIEIFSVGIEDAGFTKPILKREKLESFVDFFYGIPPSKNRVRHVLVLLLRSREVVAVRIQVALRRRGGGSVTFYFRPHREASEYTSRVGHVVAPAMINHAYQRRPNITM